MSTWTVGYAAASVGVVVAAALIVVDLLPRRGLRLGVGALVLDAVLLGTLVPLHRSGRLRARDLGLRGTAPGRAVLLVLGALLLLAVINLLWLQGVLGHPVASPHITLHESTVDKVITGAALVVVAPVTEEIFFRGLLYRALRNRLRTLPAALIAGSIFAALHLSTYSVSTLPPRVAFGILACLLYEASGSLLPSIALHGMIDGAGFEAEFTGQEGIVFAAYGTVGLMLVLWAVARRHSRRRRGRAVVRELRAS